MTNADIQEMREFVKDWHAEYLAGYTYRIPYIGFVTELRKSDRLGEVQWYYNINGVKEFHIRINMKFFACRFTSKCILWHEYAHIMNVMINKSNGGHGAGFWKCYFKKPQYVIPIYTFLLPVIIWRMFK